MGKGYKVKHVLVCALHMSIPLQFRRKPSLGLRAVWGVPFFSSASSSLSCSACSCVPPAAPSKQVGGEGSEGGGGGGVWCECRVCAGQSVDCPDPFWCVTCVTGMCMYVYVKGFAF